MPLLHPWLISTKNKPPLREENAMKIRMNNSKMIRLINVDSPSSINKMYVSLIEIMNYAECQKDSRFSIHTMI